ncbi:paraquat-inducible protein A [Amphibiibacter pelophylacis]|uniref:Paraquat-inducible protein A n=1 Tax=Amphibiibacter pelophylacis TaxID=1799477 RepID=A0ACC6NZM0_9BURK
MAALPLADTALACPHCHHRVAAPPQGSQARTRWLCPRCGGALGQALDASQRLALGVWAGCTLVLLALAQGLPFLSLTVLGETNTVSVAGMAVHLLEGDYPVLGLIYVLFVEALPLLLSALALAWLALLPRTNTTSAPSWRQTALVLVTHWLVRLRPWCMNDIFIVSVLVALVKVVSYGQVGFGGGFVLVALAAMATLPLQLRIAPARLWPLVAQVPEPPSSGPGSPGPAFACRDCHAWLPAGSRRCPRCHSRPQRPRAPHAALALLLTSALLYVPANALTMMSATLAGNSKDTNIMEGVAVLWGTGSAPIALIVFVASIVIPIAKMLALLWLCVQLWPERVPRDAQRAHRVHQLHRWVEWIGRWSMMDVFVVITLSALVDRGALMAVSPGWGSLWFAAVVWLTMWSALLLQPHSLWQRLPKTPDPAAAPSVRPPSSAASAPS